MNIGRPMTKQMRHELTLKLAALLGFDVQVVKASGFAPKILFKGDDWNPTQWINQALQLAAAYSLVIHPSLQMVEVWATNNHEGRTRYYRPRNQLIGHAQRVELSESMATAICYAVVDLLERKATNPGQAA